MPQEERVEALKNEYHIQVDDALREDVSKMCNYSDAILRMGEDKGRAEGKLDAFVDLVKDGILSIKEAAKRANLSEKEFKEKTGIKSEK